MKPFERKLQTKLRIHPHLLRALLANPSEQTLEAIEKTQILNDPRVYLAGWIHSVLEVWEVHACDGNAFLAQLIRRLENVSLSPIEEEEAALRTHLNRLKILAETPGIFPFNPIFIQENLIQILQGAENLADLPEFEVVYFSKDEIMPLKADLENYNINPLSRRYIQTIYGPERREGILSILAYIAKNHPLLNISRQAYALMLALDQETTWANHPLCMRLLYNRFWDFRLEEEVNGS